MSTDMILMINMSHMIETALENHMMIDEIDMIDMSVIHFVEDLILEDTLTLVYGDQVEKEDIPPVH